MVWRFDYRSENAGPLHCGFDLAQQRSNAYFSSLEIAYIQQVAAEMRWLPSLY
jgi:hypothetical protein